MTRRVEFAETDMAGIVHYLNYFRYMESAEQAFMRSLGFSFLAREVEPPVGWPRVHVRCDFQQPLRLEDEVEVHLLVKEKRVKSLTYLFRLRNLSVRPPVEVARGQVTVVCVPFDLTRPLAAIPIPKTIADKIEVAPPELLA